MDAERLPIPSAAARANDSEAERGAFFLSPGKVAPYYSG